MIVKKEVRGVAESKAPRILTCMFVVTSGTSEVAQRITCGR